MPRSARAPARSRREEGGGREGRRRGSGLRVPPPLVVAARRKPRRRREGLARRKPHRRREGAARRAEAPAGLAAAAACGLWSSVREEGDGTSSVRRREEGGGGGGRKEGAARRRHLRHAMASTVRRGAPAQRREERGGRWDLRRGPHERVPDHAAHLGATRRGAGRLQPGLHEKQVSRELGAGRPAELRDGARGGEERERGPRRRPPFPSLPRRRRRPGSAPSLAHRGIERRS